MSIFGDLMKFVGSTLLGKKTNSEDFKNNLMNAERRIRWGDEREDLRDYRTALESLEDCQDADADKPDDLLPKKYKSMGDAVINSARLLIDRHMKTIEGLKATKNDLIEQEEKTEKELAASDKKIADLKEDGSLIKAAEQEKHVDDIKVKLKAIKRRLADGEVESSMSESYTSLAGEIEELMTIIEGSLVNLEMNESVSAKIASTIRASTAERLDEVREEIQSLQPES